MSSASWRTGAVAAYPRRYYLWMLTRPERSTEDPPEGKSVAGIQPRYLESCANLRDRSRNNQSRTRPEIPFAAPQHLARRARHATLPLRRRGRPATAC